jgi:uncharacterized protein YdaU (DUF1376 family)
MNAPWMPLYVADYLADTGHLTAAEHGAYMLLIMHYWRQGSLPTDEQALARIGRMTPREWSRSRETISAFFDADWKHERIEEELRRANVKSTRRSQAGTRGGNAKALKNNKPAVANASELLGKSLAKPLASSSQSQSEDISLRSISIKEVFEKFWAIYPKRINRKAALAKLETAVKAGVDPEKILAGAARYAEHVRFTEPQFIKAPDAWLNAGKWDDELPAEPQKPQARASPKSGSRNGFSDLLDELRAKRNGKQQSSANEPRDITPATISEPGAGNLGSRLSEPAGKPSGGGEILDFRPASPDARRSAAPFGEAARTFDWDESLAGNFRRQPN